MPSAGFMWPGGPPLPEWIQVGAKIRSQHDLPEGVEAEITKITEALIYFRIPSPLGGIGLMPGEVAALWSAQPERFVRNWAPVVREIDPLSLDLPYYWPQGRPSSTDIGRRVFCVVSQWCWPGEKALISEAKQDVIYFIFYERPGKPTYALERQNFIRQFKPETPFAEIPSLGLPPGRTWYNAILEDDPF